MSEYRTLFDARGERYNLANRRFPEARAEEAEALFAELELTSDAPWLDLGAGGGFLGSRARATGRPGVPVGVDESVVFLADASAYRLRTVAGYPRLPFAPETLAAAASLAALHHVEDPAAVIGEMLRVTARGGRVAIGDVLEGSPASRFLNGFVHRHTSEGHAGRFFTPDAMGGLLGRAGGVRVRSAAIRIRWGFENAADAGAFCRELFGLRPGTRDGEIAAALDELGLSGSGAGRRLPWDMVFASAERA